MVGSEDGFESFKRPFILGVSFRSKEAEGSAERVVIYTDAYDMEKENVAFVCLVGAIKKEGGVVARKQFEGEQVSKEKCLESSFIHHCLSCVFREN